MKYELFNVRKKVDFQKYYPLLQIWWEKAGEEWQAIHPQFLSSRGIIIKDKERYVCAAWLYATDSAYGVINHIISNNSLDGRTKKKCINFMLEKIEEYSKFLKMEAIYTAMETRSLKKILESKGFSKTSDNISEYCKKL